MKCSVVGMLGFGQTTQWFVDSVNGDDGNTGHSPAQAFETIAQLMTEDLQTGDAIHLARGSLFREQLTALPARCTVRAYGSGARPIIDGSDVALNASFSKTAGRTNIWQIAWAHDFTAAGGKTAHRVWINGVRMRRIAVDTEVLATALTALDAQPGAFFAAPPTSGGPDTIYVHSTGSTDPTVDGKTYEITKRLWALQLYEALNQASVYSVHTRRNAHADGSLCVDGIVDDCWAEDGRIHNALCRGTIRNCRAFKIEPPAAFGQATMWVTHDTGAPADGRDVVYIDTTAEAESGVFGPTGAQNRDLTVGFFIHTAGAPLPNFGTAYYSGCSATGVVQGFSGSQTDFSVYYKCESDARLAVSGYPRNTLVILGGTYICTLASPSCIDHQNDFEVPDNIIVRGMRYATTGTDAFPLWINIDGTNVEISRCTLGSNNSGGINWFQDGNFNISECIFHGASLRVGHTGEALPGYVANRNLYWFWGGVSYYGANFQTGHSPPVDYIGLPAWQIAMGQDAGSVVADPLFNGNPMLGDFTVAANSPANALHAGADYEGEDNDAVLQALLTQYTAGLQT